MKLLTVVFPTFTEGNTNLILMGRQAPGKRMPGIRNGYGGKCEEGESVEDCAVREVKEEIGLDLKKEDLHFVYRIIEGEKDVYFYTVPLKSKISISDNSEMIDNRWFDVEQQEDYINEMLPDNERPMHALAQALRSPDEYEPCIFDLSDNKELMEATKNIFDRPDKS
jgi:8-oxo-dGTP pyrophosphatase MutT (NUDIX family)